MTDDIELKNLIDTKNTTKRNVVESLEQIIYQPHKVLDHGFIRVVDYMGDDSSIVQAARVSYGRGTKKRSQDQALINYLLRHKHTTPFEMCEIKLHIKLPFFVARQWIRHRTASVNEYSGRYSILAKEFYLPEKQNISSQSEVNKQGRSDENLSNNNTSKILQILQENANTCYKNYLEMINEDDKGNIINKNNPSISRELARISLNLSYYTEWYWKIDLHNLLHFLALRNDKHAQYEIRAYAKVICDIVKLWVPFTYNAFDEYILHCTKISKKGHEVIKKLIKGEKVNQEESGMGSREWKEFLTTFDLDE